jgi:hypothetical protein
MNKIKAIVASLVFTLLAAFGFAQVDDAPRADKTRAVLKSGFYNRTSVGVLGGSDASFSFNIVNGYQFGNRFSAGIGMGFENFFWTGYVPVFAEGNYHFLKSQTGPWVNLMAGYQVPTEQMGSNRGGFTAGGKIGFDFAINEHVGIMTAIGYRYAHINQEAIWNPWDSFVVITDINRFDFRFGFIFRQ